MTKPHVYDPGHMTKTSHTKDCCDRPAAEHVPFVEGTTTTIKLTRNVRGLKGSVIPKGAMLVAERSTYPALRELAPARWGTDPETGRFGELERGRFEEVRSPGWRVTIDGYATGLPLKAGIEA